MNKITKKMLKKLNITNFDGAYNIREDGESIQRASTENIKISSKKDKNGIDIKIEKNTKNESVHIPVILTKENYNEVVYNDFYIGQNAEVTIIAGCAIHNESDNYSKHEGIHTFYLEKNSKVNYIEEHIGNNFKKSNKIINTKTIINMNDNSEFIMNTIQKRGVNSAERITDCNLNNNAKLLINEKLLTGNDDEATSVYNVNLNGTNSALTISSRTIAKDDSDIKFESNVNGNNACFAHVECDAIIMNNAKVLSSPTVNAKHKDAILTHEAAIGKIAKEQVEKLMTLGLNKNQAENTIINNFLN